MKKILQHLQAEWYKYLLEILVITIGILGAFALNNWNENRKARQEEKVMLIDLRSDLATTLAGFAEDTVNNSNRILSLQLIEAHFANDLDYHEGLDTCFAQIPGWSSPYVTSSSYLGLRSEGVKLIRNRALRNAIVNLFDGKLTLLTEDYDQAEWSFYQSVTLPLYAKHIRRVDDDGNARAVPNDYEALKQSDEFRNMLSMIIRYRKMGLFGYKDAMHSIKDVMNQIDQELANE